VIQEFIYFGREFQEGFSSQLSTVSQIPYTPELKADG